MPNKKLKKYLKLLDLAENAKIACLLFLLCVDQRVCVCKREREREIARRGGREEEEHETKLLPSAVVLIIITTVVILRASEKGKNLLSFFVQWRHERHVRRNSIKSSKLRFENFDTIY